MIVLREILSLFLKNLFHFPRILNFCSVIFHLFEMFNLQYFLILIQSSVSLSNRTKRFILHLFQLFRKQIFYNHD
jgi:hypothetical protein